MKFKYRIFAVLVVIGVLLPCSTSFAVNVRDIEQVRNKEVLDNSDFQVIEDFLSEAVRELMEAEDFSSIADIRTAISSRSGSNIQTGQTQYGQRFYESAHRHVQAAVEKVLALSDERRRVRLLMNLLILADELKDIRMTDIGMELLDYDNAMVRYWAVHSITNHGVVKQLSSSDVENLKLTARILQRLGEVIETADTEVLELVACFAAEVKVRQGNELLLRITDKRLQQYANWTVERELFDATLLRLLYGKMSQNPSEPEVARRFAQLYSYAIQRFVKGSDILSDTAREQLASVLVEAERSFISSLLEMPQLVIKRAIENDDYLSIVAEHDRLLGGDSGAGELAKKLRFDYGQGPDGGIRTKPLVLSEPSAGEPVD